jgi:hypothetical protein
VFRIRQGTSSSTFCVQKKARHLPQHVCVQKKTRHLPQHVLCSEEDKAPPPARSVFRRRQGTSLSTFCVQKKARHLPQHVCVQKKARHLPQHVLCSEEGKAHPPARSVNTHSCSRFTAVKTGKRHCDAVITLLCIRKVRSSNREISYAQVARRFLSSSRQLLGRYRNTGHDRFPSTSSFTSNSLHY